MVRDKITIAISYFLFYSFCGWVYEVLIGLTEARGFINRGFLFGPWLPVYGFGAFMMLLLWPVKKHGPLAVFSAAALTATVVELITSYLMQAVIGVWLWDYSRNRWNYEGRIAPWPSIRFGFLALLMLYIIHPWLRGRLSAIPQKTLRCLVFIFGALFLSDCIARIFLGSNLTDPSLF